MTNAAGTRPEQLRDRMVDRIRTAGHLRSPRVEHALRTVPRHRFVPEASTEDAYADKAITIKPGTDRPASCISVPTVVAMMLDQLDPQPGERILEIGAGTGYNAALLAELVGPEGRVTTVDIHSDVVDHARRTLAETGYSRVRVVNADGVLGYPQDAPYDRIIVTVGPWDLPRAWFDQLRDGGRLVVPLHWRGQSRSIAFTRYADKLRATDSRLCGFIPMVGNSDGERTAEITDHVALYWDAGQDISPTALHSVFTRSESTVWSGITVAANEPFDHVWLWLSATEPGTCRLAAEPAAIDAGVCHAVFPYRTPAIVEGDSLAYLTRPRPVDQDDEPRFELGATGHGPAGTDLAERLCASIRLWDRDRDAQPVITVWPTAVGHADPQHHEGVVIDKEHVRLVLTHR